MSLSARVATYLPGLRRYARAVTGSQSSGDAYVAAALEALVSDLSIFPKKTSDKISIYSLFSKMYESANIEVEPLDSPFSWEKRAVEYLSLVSPLPRQAFLLNALEEFTRPEIAEILEISEEDVDTHFDAANREIGEQVATSIMIIEDEPLIAMEIEQLVGELGHEVSGIARTKDEAVSLFANKQPKMVLADIQLADGSSGIDAVNEILGTSHVPVIFITAFPERLLTGEKPEPAFLVTKPFNPDMVKALISQALFFN